MRHPGSFRDPAGFIFTNEGIIYRQITQAGKADYDALMQSGLYDVLASKGLLIEHEEVTAPQEPAAGRYKLLRPQPVATISYPYEWSFSQYQDAALATLRILKSALSKNLVLKDASAYNIQFHEGRPVLIDSLSFTEYKEGEPWQAYKQFCQHFLAPLALMSRVDPSLSKLLVTHIDGIPLPLAAKLLPKRSMLSPGLLMHLGLHSRTQVKNSAGGQARTARLSRLNFEALIDSLTRTVRSLTWRPAGTEWGDYYSFTNYTDESFEAKKTLTSQMLKRVGPKTVWDLGGNTGEFSRLASAQGAQTVCFDIDPVAVERNYRSMKQLGEKNHLPLLLDLTAPSPAIGWANAERQSLTQRGPVDVVMALAIIHHLAISNNLPFPNIAEYFAKLGEYLIIEFVPKGDSKVDILLASRPDIFPDYTEVGFEAAFAQFYDIQDKQPIPGTRRMLYFMKKVSRNEASA